MIKFLLSESYQVARVTLLTRVDQNHVFVSQFITLFLCMIQRWWFVTVLSTSNYYLCQKDQLGFLFLIVCGFLWLLFFVFGFLFLFVCGFLFLFDKCVLQHIWSFFVEVKSVVPISSVPEHPLKAFFRINLIRINRISSIPKLLKNYFIRVLHFLNELELSLKFLPNIDILNYLYLFNVYFIC